MAAKQIYHLTAMLMINTLVICCQDIAVDSWALEILHPSNESYASSVQMVGMRFGGILANSVFVALNSVDFCNKYIFKIKEGEEPRKEPYISFSEFVYYWACGQFVITICILFFVPEKVEFAEDEKIEDDKSNNSNELANSSGDGSDDVSKEVST